MTSHCCAALAAASQTLHRDACPDPGRQIAYDPVFDEYRLVDADGCLVGEPFRCCPWCTAALAPSQRLAWFAAVAAAGFTPDDPGLPVRFTTSQWWQDPG